MPDIVEVLHEEITRLQQERAKLDMKLDAARRHLAIYDPSVEAPAIIHSQPEVVMPLSAAPTPTSIEQQSPELELTMSAVEAVEIPRSINGRRLNPKSKRALVIKASVAILKKHGFLTRADMLEECDKLGITITGPSLSAILSEAPDLFHSDRYWILMNPEEHPDDDVADS